MEHIAIATPHIAGYTTQSKITGAVMVYQALARFFNWHLALNGVLSVTKHSKRHTPVHLAHQDFYSVSSITRHLILKSSVPIL